MKLKYMIVLVYNEMVIHQRRRTALRESLCLSMRIMI